MPTLLSTVALFGEPNYYTTRFKQIIEDHLLVLRNNTANNIRYLTEDEMAILDRYRGDFYGLLSALGYQPQYHWTIMRVNGFHCRFDANLELSYLIEPEWVKIDTLAKLSKEKNT